MRYLSIMAGIFGLELGIKNHVEKNFSGSTDKKIGKGRIRLRKYHNRGAFLNLGEKSQPFVAALSVLLTLLAFVLFVISLGRKGNAWLRTGLSLLLGGAFSNTYDRVRRNYVVDYFSFCTGFAGFDRVVFNLADFAILAGAMMTVLSVPSRSLED